MAGLTRDGLQTLNFNQIADQMVADEQRIIDPNINTGDNQLLGQLNNIMALQLAGLWDTLPSVVDNFNPRTAEGKYLDDLGIIMGIPRVQASKSKTSSQKFIGKAGDIIPAGTLLENPISKDRTVTLLPLELSPLNCLSVDYSVKEVLNSTEYMITVNGIIYTYTSDADATAAEIISNLQTLVSNDNNQTTIATIVGETLRLSSPDNLLPVSATTTTYISSNSVEAEVVAEAAEAGDITFPLGSVTGVVGQVPTEVTTTNRLDYSIGSNPEGDDEYRVRLLAGTAARGRSTSNAIRTALLNTQGVSVASVVPNSKSVISAEGIPPKSFLCVVQGGDDQDIGNTIWNFHGAGIRAYGNINVPVRDSAGNSHVVAFSRPEQVNVAVDVQYTLYPEEIPSTDLVNVIRNSAIDYMNALGIGIDVIPQRLLVPVYSATSGLAGVVVRIQQLANAGDTPDPLLWTTNTLPIAGTQFANTTVSDVYVSVM